MLYSLALVMPSIFLSKWLIKFWKGHGQGESQWHHAGTRLYTSDICPLITSLGWVFQSATNPSLRYYTFLNLVHKCLVWHDLFFVGLCSPPSPRNHRSSLMMCSLERKAMLCASSRKHNLCPTFPSMVIICQTCNLSTSKFHQAPANVFKNMSTDSFEEDVSSFDINLSALVDIGKSDGCC